MVGETYGFGGLCGFGGLFGICIIKQGKQTFLFMNQVILRPSKEVSHVMTKEKSLSVATLGLLLAASVLQTYLPTVDIDMKQVDCGGHQGY